MNFFSSVAMGGLQGLDYAVIIVYLVITLLIGFILTKRASKSIDDFFLGGRKLPWWALGASGMASNTDISGTMVAVGLVYVLGVTGLFIEIRGGVVLVMAFFLVFMGKWNRRAQVMTKSEWMTFRFGKGFGGDFARIVSAAAELLFTVWVVAFFALGAAGFVGPLIQDDLVSLINAFGFNVTADSIDSKFIASVLMITLSLAYSAASGLYGVVWTDVFQGALIFIAIVYLVSLSFGMPPLPATFDVSVPLSGDNAGSFQTMTVSLTEWGRAFPAQNLSFEGTSYDVFNALWLLLAVYLFRATVDGCSGSGGYTLQRYMAAETEREAGLIALVWTTLLSFRWPMVAAVALLGIHMGIQSGTPIADPEQVLPTVLNELVPAGMKGLIVACFMAAFMSTFSSWVNSSAAYWVKDVYGAYIKPDATERQLVWQGRLASLLMVLGGLAMTKTLTNINDIWGWITAVLGAGLGIPLLLRWYWWRFNGTGFALGTIAGMGGAILLNVLKDAGVLNLSDIQQFGFVSVFAFGGCISGTYASPPTDPEVLDQFYKKTRPFGLWGPVRKHLPADAIAAVNTENRRDIFLTFIAVPWQLTLFIFPMLLVLRLWSQAVIVGAILLALSLVLYFVWYRNLSSTVDHFEKPEGLEV
jgi:Na+/proline symporter